MLGFNKILGFNKLRKESCFSFFFNFSSSSQQTSPGDKATRRTTGKEIWVQRYTEALTHVEEEPESRPSVSGATRHAHETAERRKEGRSEREKCCLPTWTSWACLSPSQCGCRDGARDVRNANRVAVCVCVCRVRVSARVCRCECVQAVVTLLRKRSSRADDDNTAGSSAQSRWLAPFFFFFICCVVPKIMVRSSSSPTGVARARKRTTQLEAREQQQRQKVLRRRGPHRRRRRQPGE